MGQSTTSGFQGPNGQLAIGKLPRHPKDTFLILLYLTCAHLRVSVWRRRKTEGRGRKGEKDGKSEKEVQG